MSKPVFRNDDKFQVLKHRDWIRNNKPPGNEGYVVEDLDIVLRIYGTNYDTDSTGKFMLLELKFGRAYIDYAQRRTFGQINYMLRKADPGRVRYMGYFVVQYDNDDWDKSEFTINRVSVTRDEFVNKFLDFDTDFISSLPSF